MRRCYVSYSARILANAVFNPPAVAVGEAATITAGAEVAYGAAGFPAWGIPGNATLIFHIELLKVQ